MLQFLVAEAAKREVTIPPQCYARYYATEVTTGLRGNFAVNYFVALCFLDGKPELATFTDFPCRLRVTRI